MYGLLLEIVLFDLAPEWSPFSQWFTSLFIFLLEFRAPIIPVYTGIRD